MQEKLQVCSEEVGEKEEEENASVSAGPLGKRTPLKSSVCCNPAVTNTQVEEHNAHNVHTPRRVCRQESS